MWREVPLALGSILRGDSPQTSPALFSPATQRFFATPSGDMYLTLAGMLLTSPKRHSLVDFEASVRSMDDARSGRSQGEGGGGTFDLAIASPRRATISS